MSKEDRTQERIGYVLSGTGWATLSIRADAGLIAVAVSYLHDSLGDLARMGLDLAKGAKSAAAVFMDEPGEVHVVVTGDDDEMAFELRRYRDWASWGITAMDDFEAGPWGYRPHRPDPQHPLDPGAHLCGYGAG